MESFWSIVESDSFWATNARFSNDHEEQRLGMKKLKEVLGTSTESVKSLGDCYIICFCDEDDKLSQWRGYAPEGVSIGFDFNNIRPFYIKKKDKDEYLRVYNSSYKVQYIKEDTCKEEFIDKFDLNLSESEEGDEDIRHQASNIISYVKHRGFCEESESRLAFLDQDADLSECVQYRDVGNIKVPYIIVKAGGNDGLKRSKCFIRLNFEEDSGKKLEKGLLEHISLTKMKNIEIINCSDLSKRATDDRQCFGCTLREAYMPDVNGQNPNCRYAYNESEQFYIEHRGEIYISESKNQESVYNWLHSFLQEQEELKDVKIWCEGHLPIRSITVGNLRNKEVVWESIKHYCDQHYWLRSVDVRKSSIPFRSTLI